MAKKKANDELSPAFKISSAMQKTSARLLRFSKIMVSISGGADSDVMLDLLLKICPKEKMTFVFFDTGIEYDATKRHLDYLEKKYNIKIDRQRADVPVPLGVKKYGLPFISKMISGKLQILQNNNFDFANDGNLSYEELQEKYPHYCANYHTIGMSHAYAYCTKQCKRCVDVKKCDELQGGKV